SQVVWPAFGGAGGILFNPALAVFDNNNPNGAPIFAVTGQGMVDIGVSYPLAQVDIGKTSALYGTNGLGYLFHVGDENNSNADFFSVDQWGIVGVGQLNHGSALMEVSDMNNRDIPQFAVDGGDIWTNPYLVVSKQSVGIGINPSQWFTLGLKGGATGTAINMYETKTTGWDGAITFVAANGDVRSVITDDLGTNELTINPGMGGGANGILRVEGGLKVESTVQIGDVTTPAGYNLYVQNGILTERVKVALKSDGPNWSDYVFDKKYKLMSI